jgi:hypothetical protein
MPAEENAVTPQPLESASAADDSAPTGAGSATSTGSVDAHDNDACTTLSAIGSVHADAFAATGSLVGVANVERNAHITASITPAVLSRGTTMVQQSYASAVIVGGGAETRIHQAAAPIIVGKTTEMVQSGACAVVTGEANVHRSWVGMVVSPKATISDDSRVLISPGAALIIGLALITGIGVVAVVAVLLARRAYEQRRAAFMARLPHLPDLSALHLPDLSAMAERIKRKAA